MSDMMEDNPDMLNPAQEAASVPMEEITFSLLGREFKVACPADEKRALMETASWLNHRLEETRDNARGAGNERVALMVAMRIAHELRQNLGPAFDVDAISSRIQAMQGLIDAVLDESVQTE